MKNVIRTRMFLVLVFVVSIFVGGMEQVDAKSSISTSKKLDKATKLRVNESYGKLPLYFIRNDGQMDKKVEFYEKGSGHNTFFTKDGVYLELIRYSERATADSKQKENNVPSNTISNSQIVNDKQEAIDSAINQQLSKYEQAQPGTKSEMIRLVPLGANKDPRIIAESIQKGKVNYFNGSDPKKWKTDIPTYQAVVYKDVYEGIDMKFYGNNRQMEYDVIVKPGVDPSIVQLSYEGIEGLSVTEEGNLEIALKEGSVIHNKPYCYQDIDGKRIEVEGQFKVSNQPHETGVSNLKSQIENPQFTYGFQVASYDKKHPLIIDPVLEYSTYLGGGSVGAMNSNDHCYGIAVDDAGNMYVAGSTWSDDFPTKNAFDSSFNTQPNHSGDDAFVTKLDASGGLFYSTYLGGRESDGAYGGIGVDGAGNAYISGITDSSDFPTRNAYDGSLDGTAADAFVAKLNSSGGLSYSTYLGGGSVDFSRGIAVDDAGNAYVTGQTRSGDFPTRNAYDSSLNNSDRGRTDVFVAKFNSNGRLTYSTYLGGIEGDTGYGIAADGLGNAYVTGVTYSSNFPTRNAYDGSLDGRNDTFVAKFNAGGGLTYSTFLGGIGGERGYGIAVDTEGNAYITGNTASSNFPTQNANDEILDGGNDAFVTKFDASGGLSYSTYLGGDYRDSGYDIAVDTAGNAYITGDTASSNFPTQNANDKILDGGNDAFVTKLDASGGLFYSTYLGGSNQERGDGIAVDIAGNIYIAGFTNSSDFPTTTNAYDDSHNGGSGAADGFVAKFGSSSADLPLIADAGTDQVIQVGDLVTLDGSDSWDQDGDPLTYNWVFTGKPVASTATLSNSTSVNPTFTADVPGTYVVSLIVNDGEFDSNPSSVTIYATIYTLPVPTNGLIGHWSGEVSNGMAVDESGNGHIGTLVNGTSSTLGLMGNAFVLDGIDDFVNLGRSAEYNFEDSSISTFVWIDPLTNIGSRRVISIDDVDDLGPDNTREIFTLVSSGILDGTPGFGVWGASTRSAVYATEILDAGWHHLVGVREGAVVSIYVDGVWQNSVTGAPGEVSPEASLVIGKVNPGRSGPTGTAHFSGLVDETSLYSRALTAQEITNIFNTVSAGNIVIPPNSTPVADAGTDQSVYVNDTVTLDGSNSWDPDGDALTYNWTFTSKPAGSTAILTNATTISPFFAVDVAGAYVISLIVNDGTVDSTPDEVTMGTINVAPIANAGNNQSVIVGDMVFLDGSGSSDPDGDPLAYSWSFTSIPSGSSAAFDDNTSITPDFIPDTSGTYEVSLVVNDGTVDSVPDTMSVSAVTQQTAAITTAQETMAVINGLDEQFSEEVFNNPNNQNALTNKLNAVIVAIENGEYEDSLKKLKNDILKKTDGCAKTGEPDKNDWIKDCDAQAEAYPLVLEMIALLEQLI